MNENQLNQVLEQIALHDVPENLDLWPAMQARIGVQTVSSRERKISPIASPRRKWAILVPAVMLCLALLVILSPAGQTLADSLLQFFQPASSEQFPLSEVAPVEVAVVDEQPLDTGHTTGNLADCDDACQLALAKEDAGFVAWTLPTLPAGLQLAEVVGDQGRLVIRYEALGAGGEVVISQGVGAFPGDQWAEVWPDAVVTVQVGENAGEYVQGAFIARPDSEQANWNNSAPFYRLRWRMDGLWFEIMKAGNPAAIEYLDQEALLEMAVSLSR